jgi:uncharacterized membrane protein YfhO
VSSTAAAGWSVSLDDRDAEWLIADVMRRAVAMPAGAHRVRWTYAVPGLRAGALVALAGVLLLVALRGLDRRTRRPIVRGPGARGPIDH